MPINKGIMSSKEDKWNTPSSFYSPYVQKYNITLDVCASPGFAICNNYIAPPGATVSRVQPVAFDGLATDWSKLLNPGESAWMNPPYGKTIKNWVEKAYLEAQNGVTTIALLPSRTDTRWWHSFVNPFIAHDMVTFIKGRIHFLDSNLKDNGPAPFPSVVVKFGPLPEE